MFDRVTSVEYRSRSPRSGHDTREIVLCIRDRGVAFSMGVEDWPLHSPFGGRVRLAVRQAGGWLELGVRDCRRGLTFA